MATLEDLEARVAALEVSHADYRAVLAAVNVLGAISASRGPPRGVTSELSVVKTDVGELKTDVG